MCPRTSWWLVILLACLPVVSVRADEVTSFLEARGFDRLLAMHLEEQLEELTGDDRTEAARRLARLYAQLLMVAADPVDRTYLEARGMQLIDGIPAGEADDLRVELLNGRYLVAEDIAERHRLRLDDLGETQRAIEMLDGLIEELERIRDRTRRQLQELGRAIERGTPFRATSRRERLLRKEQLLHRTRYLLGWAYYYRAWLSGDLLAAEQAEEAFASLLDLEPGSISPEYVSRDLRSRELVAWSILGMAASRGMTQTAASSISRWFDLLEEENVPDSIRTILPGWRLAVLLDNGRFEIASALLDELVASGDVLPTAWWRLVAVHALDADDTMWARDLADRALAELAARNALNHLYDLVERYGDTLSDRSGFALSYARGVLLFQEARAMAGDQDSPPTAEAVEAWNAAGAQLEAAMSERDRDRWGTTQAACGSLLGWCLYFEGRHAEARDRFLWVLEQADPGRHEESLWMAIVCQDQLVRADSTAEQAEVLEALVERYLQRFPGGPRAGELVVRRSGLLDPSEDAVDALLAVEEGDPAWPRAQQQAARMLYRMCTEAPSDDRVEYGSRYLSIAVPLLMSDLEQGRSDPEAAGRAVARSRRVLEIALDEQVQRLVAAGTVLDEFRAPQRLAITLPEGFVEELLYRGVQLELHRGRLDAAERGVETLIANDPTGLWTRRAIRAIFRAALASWQAAGPAADRRADSTRLVRHGRLILEEHPTINEAFEQQGMVAVASAAAGAALELWMVGGDADAAREAWLYYGDLLRVHPRNQSFLRGRGLLSASQDDVEEGVRCWRLLVNGTTSGSEPWFEARTNLLELLESVDPEHARSVLEQHRILFPDWGPPPWGERLRSIQQRLEGRSP